MEVAKELKDQLKAQRLRQLEAQWYEYFMNKTAYDANGDTRNSEEMQKNMDAVERSHLAIKALDETPTV